MLIVAIIGYLVALALCIRFLAFIGRVERDAERQRQPSPPSRPASAQSRPARRSPA